MFVLLVFSFVAGVVTILSPCILPVLPIVLSGSFGQGKKRPLGIVTGFILSFTFFTLFLTSLVRTLGISADLLRTFSVFVILFFGISLISPQIQKILELAFSYFSKFTPAYQNKEGFGGGLVIGLSVGLLWTPCVGPILASVISLALAGSVTFEAFLITLFYSFGTAIPMLAVIYGGQRMIAKVPSLAKDAWKIQKIFGVLMILTAIAIYLNYDRKFQAFVLEKFPNYGAGLIRLEENDSVKKEIENLDFGIVRENGGKTTAEMLESANYAPELIPGGEWFNTNGEEILLRNLKGKVVLVDFWTYTCINCIRTLPYLTSWHEKYADDGLVVIGVHTPEFEFEKSADNVQSAIDDFKIKYPVMQDNNYATWRVYNNRYWPAKYLIDKEGKIRYTHFGEGSYDETERLIQKLLAETGVEVSENINNPPYQISSRTPELYLGYQRIEYLASPERVQRDNKVDYSKPGFLPDNRFAYEGEWEIGGQYAIPSVGSKLYLNFEAKEVFLVMRAKNGQGGRVKVSVEEELAGVYEGEDVKDGIVEVDNDRLYKIVKLSAPQRRELILEFLDGNIELYAFTFG